MEQGKSLQPVLRCDIGGTRVILRRADRQDEIAEQRLGPFIRNEGGKCYPAIDLSEPQRCVALAIDAECYVGMRLSEAVQPRHQPEFYKIGCRRNVQFAAALQVEFSRRRFKFGKGISESGKRAAQFRRGPDTRRPLTSNSMPR